MADGGEGARQVAVGAIALQRPTVALLCGSFLPSAFPPGRPVAFMPDAIRRTRNFALYCAVVQLFVSLLSLPLAAARGNLGRASTAIHSLLAAIAAVGIVGLVRLQRPLVLLHAILCIGVPVVFALFLIFTLTLSQGGHEDADAIVILIFISLFFDLGSGIVSAVAVARMNVYYMVCMRSARERAAREAGVGDAAAAAAAVEMAAPPPAAPAATEAGRAARRRGLQEQIVQGGIVPPPNAFAVAAARPPGAAAAAEAANVENAACVREATHVPVPGALLDDGRCIICMDRPRNTAFFPCGHMACAVCASQLRARSARCHICRAPVDGALRVYS